MITSFIIDQAMCEDLKDELLYTYEFLNTSKLYKVFVKRGAKWLPQRKKKLFKNEGSLFPNSDFGRCVKCFGEMQNTPSNLTDEQTKQSDQIPSPFG